MSPAPTAERARRAALLAKADLSTGMVGEFPELQGVMGRYYALHDGEDPRSRRRDRRSLQAARARTTPARPRPTASSLALADKIDTLDRFLRDRREADRLARPVRAAPRRARHHPASSSKISCGCSLRHCLRCAPCEQWVGCPDRVRRDVLDFIADRLKVHLREQGVRHDLIAAVFALRARTISCGCWRASMRCRVPRHRGRRQPADRLPPRRQHRRDRGAQGRAGPTARSTPVCCAWRRSSDARIASWTRSAKPGRRSARTRGVRGRRWRLLRACAGRSMNFSTG